MEGDTAVTIWRVMASRASSGHDQREMGTPVSGYDLPPVTTALETVVQTCDPLAARLVPAAIEQIVVDEHPDDHPARLSDLASEVVPSQTGLLRIRLECCLADPAVRAGQSPEESYADLDRRALGGRIPERFAFWSAR
ncbi:hypothetical protein [Streptomyces decoyicus]|uniref:hypothetical protein n=1 Tax=Streptomyces decoyicus TaxID=249567 RepID=UPI00386DEC67